MDCILVGGEEGRHLERLNEQAQAQGLTILWHVPGSARRPPAQLPQDAKLLLVLKSHVGHPLMDAVRILAKKQNIPFLFVNSAGFSSDLAVGLARLKINPARYGATTPPPPGHWEWTGEHWRWSVPPSRSVDGWLSLALAVATGLGLRWRRRSS